MLTQDNKRFSIQTPMGKDALLLARFRGTEGLSEMFRFDLDLFSELQAIEFEEIMGQAVTLCLSLDKGKMRFINGVISSFSQDYGWEESKGDLKLVRYSATLVPWLWLLTRTRDSRIFQKMSVPDIVEKVFSDKGFTDFKSDLTSQYEIREYTVQYNETDFNFVSRLLEEEGIHYYFHHEEGKHTLVMADHSGANPACPNQSSARFLMSGREDFGEEDLIQRLRMVKQIRAGKYTLKDYNYEIPDTDLEVTYDTTAALGPGEREYYDYPGRYPKREAGDSLAAIRMEEEEARIATLSGTGSCRAFASGFRFMLMESEREDWNEKEYLLTRLRHRMDQADTYVSGTDAAQTGPDRSMYENQFECMAHEVPFRPRRKTPVPVIDGVQTAIVVGPSGEEIYTDELGRIKVQFHWDREGKYDENSTCWLRVGQSMAGLGWGAVYLPRIGHEVIVEFIDGNPDRPIVTGQVYHGVNTPPYALPDEKTKTTFKSNSSPGEDGFNEIRFEDKAGEEQVFIHAQKNLDLRTGNDRFETIGHDRHLHVSNDKFEDVENDRHEAVKGEHREKISGDRHLKVEGKEAKKVSASKSLTVEGNVIEVFQADHSEQTGADYYLKAANVVIEATSNITLGVGGSYIAIEPGSIEIESPGEIRIKGNMTDITGSAVTAIKGGIIKIN